MKKYDFILLYEHIVRELDSLCLVYVELTKLGYSGVILNVNDADILNCEGVFAKTELLVIPFCYCTKDLLHLTKHKIRFKKVVNMQWEQIISAVSEESDSFGKMTGMAKDVDIISWGEKNQGRLTTTCGFKPSKIHMLGAIKNDFLTETLFNLFKSRTEICKEYNLPSDKKIILFVGAFYGVEDGEEYEKFIVQMFGEKIMDLQNAVKEGLACLIEWFDKFLSNNKDYIFIYRPHPGEKTVLAYTLLKKYENFKIIGSDDVKQWIKIADIVCMWNSTVIVDSLYAEKETYYLSPTPIPKEHSNEIWDDMPAIKSYEEFEYAMKKGTNLSLIHI